MRRVTTADEGSAALLKTEEEPPTREGLQGDMFLSLSSALRYDLMILVSLASTGLAWPQDWPTPLEDSLKGIYLPAMDYRSESVEHWIGVLREQRGCSSEALWSLYYYDVRTPDVMESLREVLERGRRAGRREYDEFFRSSTRLSGWRSPRNSLLDRQVDAIFDHWGVEHECLDLMRYSATRSRSSGSNNQNVDAFYPLPVELLDASNAELASLLESDGLQVVERAAVTLISRQEEIGPSVRALVKRLGGAREWWHNTVFDPVKTSDREEHQHFQVTSLPWALAYAGSAGEWALADLLRDSETDGTIKRDVLDQILIELVLPNRLRANGALPSALANMIKSGTMSQSACHSLLALYGLPPRSVHSWDSADWFSYAYPREPLDQPQSEESLAAAIGALLTANEQDWPLGISDAVIAQYHTAEDPFAFSHWDEARDLMKLITLHEVIRRSDLVFERVRPWLLERLDRPGALGDVSLRLLCAMGEGGERIRAAYLRHLSRLDPSDSTQVFGAPRLREHDVSTRESLTRLAQRTSHPSLLRGHLRLAGLLDARDRSESIPALKTNWSVLNSEGYTGVCEFDANDDLLDRAAKASIRARSKARRGLGFGEEANQLWWILLTGTNDVGTAPRDYFESAIDAVAALPSERSRLADWGIGRLQNYFGTFSGHKRAIRDALMATDLTRRQQAALCQAHLPDLEDGWAELLAQQGGASLERIGALRLRAYGSVAGLADVLRITQLSQLDEQLLLGALKRGPAREREAALKVVREFELNFPGLREAVQRRRSDCDDRVQLTAKEVCSARDW